MTPPWGQDKGDTTEVNEREAGAERTESVRERRLHGLAVLSLFLHSTATIQEMVGMLMEHAHSVTGAIFVYPLMLDKKRQLLRASILEGSNDTRLEAAMDAFQEDLTALEFSLVKSSELSAILNDGEVVLRDGFSTLMEGVVSRDQWEAAESTIGVRKLALVPMVVENEPLGIVAFGFDGDEVDVEILELVVGHLTLALRDLLVRDEAVRFSDIDPVTWVHNRRYLVQALEQEIARAGRYGRGLSLITLDIDDFTQFNETYGQSMGDRLLRTFATTLAEAVSPPELVARLKDDDFAILLPETNRAAAVTAATRLLASLAQVSVFDGEDSALPPVTACVAISCFPEDGATPRVLIEQAVADMESAKRDRRGRIPA
ncbi:MAG: GGDEF domain-containing protein, partial [Chloroflexi bacterium]|nr:GGDEF domain-containing protein [Chloroflexota bacterium]